MGPNQVWSELSEAVELNNWEKAEELAHELAGRIADGGVPPLITGNADFDRIVVRATIEAIMAWEVG